MRPSNSFLVAILFLCLSFGVAAIGCGEEDGNFAMVDLEQLCAQSQQAMDGQACRDAAYAGVDELKDCLMACGPEDPECQEEHCFSAPGSGFSGCTGDVGLLFSGQCDDCHTECAFDFIGDASEPGCLFDPNPANTGEQCLDDLYVCVEERC
jgi:hypothetical protein